MSCRVAVDGSKGATEGSRRAVHDCREAVDCRGLYYNSCILWIYLENSSRSVEGSRGAIEELSRWL